jgi:protein-S-isoprenylcysteine O-methyltransferase Ste14
MPENSQDNSLLLAAGFMFVAALCSLTLAFRNSSHPIACGVTGVLLLGAAAMLVYAHRYFSRKNT